jgi:hypothetical protein
MARGRAMAIVWEAGEKSELAALTPSMAYLHNLIPSCG